MRRIAAKIGGAGADPNEGERVAPLRGLAWDSCDFFGSLLMKSAAVGQVNLPIVEVFCWLSADS